MQAQRKICGTLKPLGFFSEKYPSPNATYVCTYVRQVRQLNYILKFQVTMAYTRGPDNVMADALSRVESMALPANLELVTFA